MNGEFPNSIFQLPKIQAIDLSGNKFLTGFLPEFPYGSLLKELHLSRTRFSGKLPSSIGNLKALNVFSLYDANFYGELPNSIGSLNSLNILDLFINNFLGEIPSSLGNLSQLIRLSFSSNNFNGQLHLHWETL